MNNVIINFFSRIKSIARNAVFGERIVPLEILGIKEDSLFNYVPICLEEYSDANLNSFLQDILRLYASVENFTENFVILRNIIVNKSKNLSHGSSHTSSEVSSDSICYLDSKNNINTNEYIRKILVDLNYAALRDLMAEMQENDCLIARKALLERQINILQQEHPDSKPEICTLYAIDLQYWETKQKCENIQKLSDRSMMRNELMKLFKSCDLNFSESNINTVCEEILPYYKTIGVFASCLECHKAIREVDLMQDHRDNVAMQTIDDYCNDRIKKEYYKIFVIIKRYINFDALIHHLQSLNKNYIYNSFANVTANLRHLFNIRWMKKIVIPAVMAWRSPEATAAYVYGSEFVRRAFSSLGNYFVHSKAKSVDYNEASYQASDSMKKSFTNDFAILIRNSCVRMFVLCDQVNSQKLHADLLELWQKINGLNSEEALVAWRQVVLLMKDFYLYYYDILLLQALSNISLLSVSSVLDNEVKVDVKLFNCLQELRLLNEFVACDMVNKLSLHNGNIANICKNIKEKFPISQRACDPQVAAVVRVASKSTLLQQGKQVFGRIKEHVLGGGSNEGSVSREENKSNIEEHHSDAEDLILLDANTQMWQDLSLSNLPNSIDEYAKIVVNLVSLHPEVQRLIVAVLSNQSEILFRALCSAGNDLSNIDNDFVHNQGGVEQSHQHILQSTIKAFAGNRTENSVIRDIVRKKLFAKDLYQTIHGEITLLQLAIHYDSVNVVKLIVSNSHSCQEGVIENGFLYAVQQKKLYIATSILDNSKRNYNTDRSLNDSTNDSWLIRPMSVMQQSVSHFCSKTNIGVSQVSFSLAVADINRSTVLHHLAAIVDNEQAHTQACELFVKVLQCEGYLRKFRFRESLMCLKDANGRIPLHIIILHGNSKLLKKLYEHDNKIFNEIYNLQSSYEYTPLELARNIDKQEIYTQFSGYLEAQGINTSINVQLQPQELQEFSIISNIKYKIFGI